MNAENVTADGGSACEADRTDIGWIEEAIGPDLFSFILGCDKQILGQLRTRALAPSSGQESVLKEIVDFRAQSENMFSASPAGTVLGAALTQVGEAGISVARHLRASAGSEDPLPEATNALERLLVSIAADAYPVYLLPPDPDIVQLSLPDKTNRLVYPVVFGHPKSESFRQAVLEDEVFGKIFPKSENSADSWIQVYRNTGAGGGLQLATFPHLILGNAWRQVSSDRSTLVEFCRQVLEELRSIRDIFAGKGGKAKAKIALAGILLPADSSFEVGDALVREVTVAERTMVPGSLKGQVGGTDVDGAPIHVNYDGDVLLEYEFPYKVKFVTPAADSDVHIAEWPDDMYLPMEIEQTIVRLRFSLVMAVNRDYRVQLVPTWRRYEEALMTGWSFSWNDPRQGTSITPTRLAQTEVDEWRKWYELLSSKPAMRIELALTRILRAIAERREPSDVLIDSVIAWENLFGTKEGEPTFRVTTCLAKLLEQDGQARLKLKTRLGKIYALRSKVVHGSGVLKRDEYPLCTEALDVAIEAVRILIGTRTDILNLADGALRSAELLLRD
jgi:hypothetical protein